MLGFVHAYFGGFEGLNIGIIICTDSFMVSDMFVWMKNIHLFLTIFYSSTSGFSMLTRFWFFFVTLSGVTVFACMY